MTGKPLEHVFISYAHSDNDVAHRIARDLSQSGIHVWIDVQGLVPGTPNWEQAVRDAIDKSFAILLVASPDARKSSYVQGELSVARIRNRPIFPIWVKGENWIDCVPLDMVNYQYIDCRMEQYGGGFGRVLEILQQITGTSDELLSISLPTHEKIQVNPAMFHSFANFLNYVYGNYLIDWYPPLTYGTQWVLGNIASKRLAVPWLWLSLDNETPLSKIYSKYGSLSLDEYGIVPNSEWAVWEATRVKCAGVATNNPSLADTLLAEYNQRDIWVLHSKQCLKIKKSDEVIVNDYRFHFVIALFGTTYDRVAFVDTDIECA